MSGIRFTVWLSHEERARLRKLAELYGTSQNYIIRIAVRGMLDLPLRDDQKQMTWQRITSPGPPRRIPFSQILDP
jgi:predicted transcriptional regulator